MASVFQPTVFQPTVFQTATVFDAVANAYLAFMEWCQVYEPGLPVSPGTLGQDDQQQLLNDFPGVLWGTGGGGGAGAYMWIHHHHHANG